MLKPESLSGIEGHRIRIFGHRRKAVVDHFGLDITMRVAGGWVRDKLMGKESNDLDIALDKMLGQEFAEMIQKYQELQGGARSKVAVILANPDQSKHLETARTKILGMEIDLVNLRTEEYSSGSRIPDMKFGTPLQDARRRDFTINTLFYNLRTRQVEDFTGKGLDDLQSKIVRTPLPAIETFRDDPLRILRAVRFASRLQFRIDADVAVAAGNPDIQSALMLKVSRERVGVEVDKMLHGEHPVTAVRMIRNLGLFDSVFTIPKDGGEQEFTFWRRCALLSSDSVAAAAAAFWLAGTAGSGVKEQDVDAGLLVLSAALQPVADVKFSEKPGRPAVAVSSYVILESLKLPKRYRQVVLEAHAASSRLAQAGGPEEAAALPRGDLGMLVRQMGANWRYGVLLLAATAISKRAAAISGAADYLLTYRETAWPGDNSPEIDELRTVAERFGVFVRSVRDAHLSEAHKAKSIVKGIDIAAALGIRPHAGFRAIMDAAMKRQLSEPNETRDGLLEWVRRERETLLARLPKQ